MKGTQRRRKRHQVGVGVRLACTARQPRQAAVGARDGRRRACSPRRPTPSSRRQMPTHIRVAQRRVPLARHGKQAGTEAVPGPNWTKVCHALPLGLECQIVVVLNVRVAHLKMLEMHTQDRLDLSGRHGRQLLTPRGGHGWGDRRAPQHGRQRGRCHRRRDCHKRSCCRCNRASAGRKRCAGGLCQRWKVQTTHRCDPKQTAAAAVALGAVEAPRRRHRARRMDSRWVRVSSWRCAQWCQRRLWAGHKRIRCDGRRNHRSRLPRRRGRQSHGGQRCL